MNIRFLTIVSTAALLASMPAMAENELGRSLDRAGETVSRAADSVKRGTQETYRDIRAAVLGAREDSGNVEYIDINSRNTASGMIGKEVRSETGVSIARMEDIILDKDGRAELVVLANGGFMGLGEKKAAFKYADITRQDSSGDVVMALTEETVKKAAEFTTDDNNKNPAILKMPAGGYSAAAILKADVVDPDGKKVANVSDLLFVNGKAARVIISFDTVMGMGGETAAFNYNAVNLAKNDQGMQFRLSAAQAEQLDSLRKAVKKSQ